jgi:uncharacterized membrane protein YccC
VILIAEVRAKDVAGRSPFHAAFSHSVAITVACLISFWLVRHCLARIHSVSRDDDLLGGMWSVLATVFVYRTNYHESVDAAASRTAATLVSFVLSLAYLLLFPFSTVGLALLIGLSSFVLTMIGRRGDVITAAITITVVLVVATLNPDNAWQQPILRLVDTIVGVAVGLGAVWVAQSIVNKKPPGQFQELRLARNPSEKWRQPRGSTARPRANERV